MSQLDQLAAGAIVRARPWDAVGVALAAPMVVWGFLGWFGTVGDSGGGQPGFFAGTGAAGIGLVLAASALTLSHVLAGRPYDRTSPPAPVFLAGVAAIIVLGGLIAKPDSTTIQAGAVAGLLTALSQCTVLVLGWLRGSEKTLKAANVRALQAQQDAADQAAQGGYRPDYPQPQYPNAQYPLSQYPNGQYPNAQYPSGAAAPAAYPQGYPQQGYPQAPPPQYPQAQYPYPQGTNPTGQYPYPQGQSYRG
jgi:hypothetical protein